MKLRNSLFATALTISAASSTLVSSNFAFANSDDSANSAATTQVNENDYVKVVFLNGLPDSWWVPGMNRANQEVVDSVKTICSEDGQSCALWTWGNIKDVPSDLYKAGSDAIASFTKVAARPMEIWTKECPETFADTVSNAIQEAQGQSNPAQQRLTVLSGQTLAYLRYMGKATIQAPLAAFYHAATGVLAVPVQGGWSFAKIAGGATGTVLENVYRPVITGLRYGQAVTCSSAAAVGVGVANYLVPQTSLPEKPLLSNEESATHDQPAETAPTLMEVVSGGETH